MYLKTKEVVNLHRSNEDDAFTQACYEISKI